MKNFILLTIIVSCYSLKAQINIFTSDICGRKFEITYVQNTDTSIKLMYDFKISGDTILTAIDANNNLNPDTYRSIVLSAVNQKFSQIHLVKNFRVINYDSITKSFKYELSLKYLKDNFLNNPKQLVVLYNELNSYLKIYNLSLTCNVEDFVSDIESNINNIKNQILADVTEKPSYVNKEIIQSKKAVDGLDNTNTTYIYNRDIRNPISFVNFIVRNPRINGKSTLVNPSNLSSYNYIRPGALISILFTKEVYSQLNNIKVKISAYLKRNDGSIIPVNVNGFHEVELISNVETYKSKAAKGVGSENNLTVDYNYSVKLSEQPPIQTEINTELLNPQPEEKLYVTIRNAGDNNVSFTTVFEFEDYGWTSQATGGFAWVNTVNAGTKDFVAAGTSAYNFYYKLDKGANFVFGKLLNPSFGPELVVLQDSTQKTLVGLGGSVSTLLRTVKVGYGWFLNGNNGRPYVSIGVNFIEGFQAISSILDNVKTQHP